MVTPLEAAILALDSYNRSGFGLDLDGAIGRFSPDKESLVGAFFAQEYRDGSEIVISYRGTDDPWSDATSGWLQGLGYLTVQAQEAARFYRTVNGNSISPNGNITLTGHSLGGGLAGFVGSIYGVNSKIFDNMPYSLSASNLHNQTKTNLQANETGTYDEYVLNPQMRQEYFQGAEPPVPTNNSLAYKVGGEFLAWARLDALGAAPNSLNAHASLNAFTQLHSQALLVSLMWAKQNGHDDWSNIGQELWNAFFSAEVANAANVDQKIHSSTEVKAADKMERAIAYTAIEDGTKPFGDQALKSMFGDADELGNLYEKSGVNEILTDANVKNGFAEIAVQYAAELAIQESTNTTKGKELA